MFNPEDFAVNGIKLIVVIFGLVEFLKDLLDWSGKRVTMLAAGLGALGMVAYQLIGILPDPYEQVAGIVFASLAFGLSASGYYKFVNKRAPEIVYLNDENDPDE